MNGDVGNPSKEFKNYLTAKNAKDIKKKWAENSPALLGEVIN